MPKTYRFRIISGPLDPTGESILVDAPSYREIVQQVDAQYLYNLLMKFHQIIDCTNEVPFEVSDLQEILDEGCNVLLIGSLKNQLKIGFDIERDPSIPLQ